MLGTPDHADLSYGPDPAHRLDLYLPAARPAPVVVFLHGGGWSHGDKFPCPAAPLAAAGFAVASVNYRLTTVARFPAQLDDVRRAVTWLGDHAADYGLTADRIGVWGVSAGGHLAALLGNERRVQAGVRLVRPDRPGRLRRRRPRGRAVDQAAVATADHGPARRAGRIAPGPGPPGGPDAHRLGRVAAVSDPARRP